jgi:UDP-N-acetylglucosamine 2-epimerase
MILVCYGTRPEWIKLSPVIDELKKRNIAYRIVFIKQHKDLVVGEFDYAIEITEGFNRLDSIVAHCMNRDCWNDITYTMVQGDTATAFGMALASFHREIPVIHLEAGLRTDDKKNPYPEETYRCMISSIADIHLCPTDANVSVLMNRFIEGRKYQVGNTVLDTINTNEITEKKNKVLVTMHRRENHEKMHLWFDAINNLAKKYKELEFILPIHPNPNVQRNRHILTDVKIIDPLPRDALIEMIKRSAMVVSDSGGIQEECSYLKSQVIVCRKVTERPESVGTTSFLCRDPENLESIFAERIYKNIVNAECPYGDGRSSKYIVDILEKL